MGSASKFVSNCVLSQAVSPLAIQLDCRCKWRVVVESRIQTELTNESWNYGVSTAMAFYCDQHGLEADLIVESPKRVYVIEATIGKAVASD
ncbi:MAG: hypothetical protein SGJ09_01400 [Phycisphaerae bacterium]|nr:hypothetical protein [Phycisphaerae bacterium]